MSSNLENPLSGCYPGNCKTDSVFLQGFLWDIRRKKEVSILDRLTVLVTVM